MRRPRLLGPIWLAPVSLLAGSALGAWIWNRREDEMCEAHVSDPLVESVSDQAEGVPDEAAGDPA